MKHIAVVMGGPSAEREVSLRTGKAVAEALLERGHKVVEMELDDQIVEKLKAGSYDCVFIAVHGKYGEDGVLQGVLDLLNIPYTGPGVLASAMAMDKGITKQIFDAAGVPTPPYKLLSKGDLQGNIVELVGLELPLVVKASTQGSSIGVFIVQEPTQLEDAVQQAFTYSDTVLVEKFIKGRELTVGILGNDNPEALPVIEIVPKSGKYDYESKYTKGATEYLVPASLDSKGYKAVQDAALKAFKALMCKGISRADVLLDAESNLYVLEVNTVPGMTETSLVPKAAAAMGISFPELCDKIVELALEK